MLLENDADVASKAPLNVVAVTTPVILRLEIVDVAPVSYTHLTLPTNREV